MPTHDAIPDDQRNAFYRAGVAGLRALDARERGARRLGTDADARWAEFAGHLDASDRIDLLLRDAAVSWKAAFSPAVVFALPGLAPDEPSGPDWKSLPDVDARRLAAESATHVNLALVAGILGIRADGLDAPPLTERTRVVAVGGSGVLAVAVRFEHERNLSWSDQVVVVAETPQARQLAGLTAVIVGASSATRFVDASADRGSLRAAAGWPTIDVVVAGSDLTPAESAFLATMPGR